MTQNDINNAVNAIVNQYTGQTIDAPEVEKGQCPAPVVRYVLSIGAPAPSMFGDRADGWGVQFPSSLAPFFSHESFQSGRSYPKGTILMWNSPHIAIVLSSDGSNNVDVFEQNADPDGAPCHSVGRVVSNSYHSATYALVPIVTEPAPDPAPAPQAAPSAPSVGGPDYDGNAITIQPGWGLSNAAEAAGYPDAVSPLRWQAIAQLNGSNDWQTFNANLKPGQRIIVGKYVAPNEAPAPTPPAPTSNIAYSKLDVPLTLVTNKNPTDVWELDFATYAEAKSSEQLADGSPFVAYGMAKRTDLDHPVYYMTQDDFGSADSTGTPATNRGVNTADLSTSPLAPPPMPEATPSTPVDNTTTGSTPADGEKVDVHVLPPSLDAKFQYQRFLNPQMYTAIKLDEDIEELQRLTNPDGSLVHKIEQLVPTQPVEVAGKMTYEGKSYYRTKVSVDNGLYYGIPIADLVREDDITDEELKDLELGLEDVIHDLKKEKVLRTGAEVEGFLKRLLHPNKK